MLCTFSRGSGGGQEGSLRSGVNSAVNVAWYDFEPTQLERIFAAAEQTKFPLFFSFDMLHWNKAGASDAMLNERLAVYANKSTYHRINGKIVVSTFNGAEAGTYLDGYVLLSWTEKHTCADGAVTAASDLSKRQTSTGTNSSRTSKQSSDSVRTFLCVRFVLFELIRDSFGWSRDLLCPMLALEGSDHELRCCGFADERRHELVRLGRRRPDSHGHCTS